MFINLDDVLPGMKLEYSVKDKAGRVLLNGGTVMDDAKIRALRAWGVFRIHIDKDSVAEAITDPDVLEAFLHKHESKVDQEELKFLFRHTYLRHPFMEQLFSECLARLAAKQELS